MLWALRFLSVFFISVLLLSPLIKSKWTETEKPVILFLNDNSSSIKIKQKSDDSSALAQQFSKLKSELGNDYDLKEYTFGAALHEGDKIDYKENATNISDALTDLYNQYSNQNVGAVILSTDGIFNQGSNPIYSHGDWMVPFYTVALGDTSFQKDVFIGKTYYNKTCYLHDETQVKVDLGANFLSGQNVDVQVNLLNGNEKKQVYAHTYNCNGNHFSTSFEFIVNAEKTGILHYQIKASEIKGEITFSNNTQDIYVEVLDSRQKVLIVANSPHPDLAALKSIIENNNNYDCQIKMVEEFSNNDLNGLNLLILHQLPSNKSVGQNIAKAATDKHLPIVFVLGTSSNLNGFNQQQNLLSITGSAENTNEAVASLNKDFNSFTLDEKTTEALKGFPPLYSPFGDYKTAGFANVLAYQKIGSAATHYPLIAMGEMNGNKTAVIAGEGLWRWRLYDFMQHQNNDATKEILQKLVQFMVVKNDKRNFKATPAKTLFNENEAVSFEAYLYNDNYELVNSTDVMMNITDEKGKNFSFTFNKTEKAYSLNCGGLPIGNYSFVAKTNFNGKEQKSSGMFSVVPLQLEGLNTIANHQMLATLSKKTGGQMVYPSQAASIADFIKKAETIKPVIYTNYRTTTLLNWKWLFFIILALLTAEWFLRKYWGGY